MRNVFAFAMALFAMFALTSSASAADGLTTVAPIGMGLTVLGIGVGLGLIGLGAMSGIARQPEQAGTIRTAMLIIGGLVEGAGILALVFCLVAKQ
jgi:F-type H+-transporting ATPase subunit c